MPTQVPQPQPQPCPAPGTSSARWPSRANADAVRFHQTGNWLWAVGQLWALAVPAALLFSGLSARLRTAARRMGRTWSFTIGVYALLYITLVFVVDLPLAYYAGFVRQHAYGLSHQSLALVRQRTENASGRPGRRVPVSVGPLPAAGAVPQALVDLHDRVVGAIRILRDADRADLDRSAVQPIRADEGPGPGMPDRGAGRSCGDLGGPDLRG